MLRILNLLKRCSISFAISCICGTVTNLLIEVIVRAVTGLDEFSTMTPEFVSMFPSETIAVEVNILLYGIIGAGFSAMTFIYEQDRIGFVIQNMLYFILTAIIWVPIVVLIWQIDNYWKALVGTLIGFSVTYIIMTVVGYRTTKGTIKEINMYLEQI